MGEGSAPSLDPLLSLENSSRADWDDERLKTIGDKSGDKKTLHNGATETQIILHIEEAVFLHRWIVGEILFWFLILCTGGLIGIPFYWYPRFHAWIRYQQVPANSPHADHVLVVAMDERQTICDITVTDPAASHNGWVYIFSHRRAHGEEVTARLPRSFEWRHARFWFVPATGTWARYHFNTTLTGAKLHELSASSAANTTVLMDKQIDRTVAFDRNELNIRVPPLWQITIVQALRPFICFQFFSVGVWFAQEYTLFASLILALTVLAIIQNGVSQWLSLRALQRLALTEGHVRRMRIGADGIMTSDTVSAVDLAPGDVIVVPSNHVMHCDAILLSGACVVNESMLTGESTPVLKCPAPVSASHSAPICIDADRDARHILFAGTDVLQAKPAGAAPDGVAPRDPESPLSSLWQLHDCKSAFPVLAVVARTGFATSRGQLVRSILFPKPMKFDFEGQSSKFVWLLFFGFLIGGSAQIGIYVQNGESAETIILDLLNLVTIAIPPSLPIALTFGIIASFARLKKRGIFCASSSRIAAAGRVNLLAFDKTGTLTEDGLSLRAVVPASEGVLGIATNDVIHILEGCPAGPHIGDVLLACHALSVLDDILDQDASFAEPINSGSDAERASATWSGNGLLSDASSGTADMSNVNREEVTMKPPRTPRLVGDPLELSMFEGTGWQLSMRPPPPTPACGVWAHPLMPATVVEAVLPPRDSAATIACYAILRRFDFDADLRRMSTLVLRIPVSSTETPQAMLLLKGAPESVHPLCDPKSVPSDVVPRLAALTRRGLRVLSLAYRSIDSLEELTTLARAQRAEVEHGLTFCGLLVLENRLKNETTDVMCEYARAGLRLVMATGDNALTAVAVAKQCGPVFLRPWRPTLLVDVDGQNRVTVEYNSSWAATEDQRETHETEMDRQIKNSTVIRDARAALRTASSKNIIPNTAALMESQKSLGTITYGATDKPVAAPTIPESIVVLLDELLAARAPGAVLMAPLDASTLRKIPEGFPLDSDLAVTGRAFAALLNRHTTIVEERIAASGVRFHTGALEKTDTAISPLEAVLSRGAIFARMSPNDKQELVRSLQDMHYVVCMTGDGANDANALKAADVGVSIAARAENTEGRGEHSKDKSSVAAAPSIAAPFSTRMHHVGAVRIVLTEGRSALVTSFTLFKFMFEYGFVQFLAVLICYSYLLELADNQYVYHDIILVLMLGTTIPTLKGLPVVSRGKPECNLLSPSVLRSIIPHVLILTAFQIGQAMAFVNSEYYVAPPDQDEEDFDRKYSMLATVAFLFSNFQYIFLALAFCQSYGVYRQPIYRSWPLSLLVLFLFILSTCLLLVESPGLAAAFELIYPPLEYRVRVWIMALGNGAVHMLYERLCVPHESDDEEPVSEMDRLTDAVNEFNGVKNVPKPGQGVDCQVTVLPKLRMRAPLHYRLKLLADPIWSQE